MDFSGVRQKDDEYRISMLAQRRITELHHLSRSSAALLDYVTLFQNRETFIAAKSRGSSIHNSSGTEFHGANSERHTTVSRLTWRLIPGLSIRRDAALIYFGAIKQRGEVIFYYGSISSVQARSELINEECKSRAKEMMLARRLSLYYILTTAQLPDETRQQHTFPSLDLHTIRIIEKCLYMSASLLLSSRFDQEYSFKKKYSTRRSFAPKPGCFTFLILFDVYAPASFLGILGWRRTLMLIDIDDAYLA